MERHRIYSTTDFDSNFDGLANKSGRPNTERSDRAGEWLGLSENEVVLT